MGQPCLGSLAGGARKILPASEYPLVDLPISHAIFRTLFEAKRIPQIPNIGFFRGSGGRRPSNTRQRHTARVRPARRRAAGSRC